jgi:hypothetical protein
VRDQEIADGAAAIARHAGRIFSGAIGDLVVEQENPVFDPGDGRLDQDRVVVLRNSGDISQKRRFAVNSLREIATRTEQGLDEGCSAQSFQIFERVIALMTRGAMGTMPVMQEEIFAAQRGCAGALKNPAGEIFVRGQRRGGGVVLRIGLASPGAEVDASGR